MLKFLRIYFILLSFLQILSAGSINEELFNKAEKYYSSKSYSKAITIYENLLKEENFINRELLLFHLGSCYSFLRQNEKSYYILSQLFKEYPHTKYLKKSLKIIVSYLKHKKDFKTALELLKEKSRIIGSDNEINKMRLEIYEYNEDYKEALKFLEKSFSLSFWFIQKKVYYLQEIKKYDKAITFIKTHLPQFKRIELYQSMADLYELKQDFNNSILWYDKLYTKTGNINHIINQCRMLFSNNLLKQGQQTVSKIFKYLGDNIRTYKQIAEIYKEFGIYNKLLKLYNKGIKKGFDFHKEKINVYEVMGKYEKAVYEYLKFLKPVSLPYISEKILNIALYEEQLILIEKSLKKYKNQFSGKKDLIIKIQINLYLRFNQYNKIYSALEEEYFTLKKVDNNFLETIINSLFNTENYEYIMKIYNLMPEKIKKNINPVIKLRYAQSLYVFEKHRASLKILKDINQKALKNAINYHIALNYLKLKDYNKAIQCVKKQFNNESMDLYFKLLILKTQYQKAMKLISGEMKKKQYPKSKLFFNEIIVNLFLNEYTIIIKDLKKYIEIYPQTDEANDCVNLLFLLDNEFIKNNKNKKKQVMKFFQFYYLKNHKKIIKILKELHFNNDNLDSILFYYLARAYMYNSEYDKSIEELKKIIKIKSFIKPFALELLGWIYLNKLGKKQTAYKYYKKILAKYSSFINVNNIRKIIVE